MPHYSIGLDYGTSSVRALLVDIATGEEITSSTFDYPHGQAGVILSAEDPHFARQHPGDYAQGAEETLAAVVRQAAETRGIQAAQIVGIGVDATGSTPIPLDAAGQPLAMAGQFENDPAALAWLWKDHTAHEEAARITRLAAEMRPAYLAKCGGTYSAEWFWSKILHCIRTAPAVAATAATWAEQSDYIPAMLCGVRDARATRRNICAAGHKAMANPAWKGYPDAEFLGALDPELARVRESLPEQFHTIAESAGGLSEWWAQRTGLRSGMPVAVGAIDAHMGAVGSGIEPGVLVKIIGTSTCDMMTAPLGQALPDIPGLCGIVPGSILPDAYGLEAGQSAVGDIFNWFAALVLEDAGAHARLTAQAARLRPGESGLIALDWHNGNRTVLIDQRLTGGLIGLTLHTTPAEIYRALIEATAFGARIIMERFEEYGVKVHRVINGGGIASKNDLAMQIYADIMNRPIEIARSAQTCALGAAIAGAVAAKKTGGGHDDYATAVHVMAGRPARVFGPDARAAGVYEQLYGIYRRLHDAFGIPGRADALGDVMKRLLAVRDEAVARR
jgi:L-ribulokinase